VVLPLSILCRESCLLVSWCASDRCGMVGSDKDCGRNRRSGAVDRRLLRTCWVFGGQMVERSGDTVCSLYCAQGDEECKILGLALKSRSMVSLGLATKLVALSFLVSASKPVATVW
jgi:hypothetical protein